MGETKVLCKYYASEFDSAKTPRRKLIENNRMRARMMMPMNVRCLACGSLTYRGTIFNCTKEDVEGEAFLGIPVFRFYFNCKACSSEITITTDPQNAAAYVVESGAAEELF